MGALMALPQEGLVAGATKPVWATQEPPTVLKSDPFLISAGRKREEKCKQTVHSRKTRRHLRGRLQGQASKKHILEAGC